MLERQIENVCKIKTSKKHYICCIYRMYLCIFFFLYTGGQGQTIPHQQIESSFRIKCFPLLAKVRSSLYPCRVLSNENTFFVSDVFCIKFFCFLPLWTDQHSGDTEEMAGHYQVNGTFLNIDIMTTVIVNIMRTKNIYSIAA